MACDFIVKLCSSYKIHDIELGEQLLHEAAIRSSKLPQYL